MSPNFVRAAAPLALLLSFGSSAYAQAPSLRLTLPDTLPEALAPARGGQAAAQPMPVTNDNGDWQFTVYPILVWVPTTIDIEVTGPFDIDGGGGGNGGGGNGGNGGSGDVGGSIVDGRFDGAFFAGFSATNGTWRFDFDGVYAAVGGDRVTPNLTVDVNLIYAHATVSREIAGGFFVTGGVRRFALKYDIDFLDYETFTRKPGIWDPLVGVAYHKVGDSLQFHAHAEYGGFGVGSDQDFGVGARVDWTPWEHVGFTAGYSLVTFRFTQDVGPYEFKARHTVGGPVAGIGLYF
jgi:hypothetical protein